VEKKKRDKKKNGRHRSSKGMASSADKNSPIFATGKSPLRKGLGKRVWGKKPKNQERKKGVGG